MRDPPEDESQLPNEAVVLELYAAVNRSDLETAKTMLDRNVVWSSPGTTAMASDSDECSPGTPKTVIETVFTPQTDRVDRVQAVPDRVTESDGSVVVDGAFIGTEVDGSPFEISFTHGFDVRDGTVQRITWDEDRTVVQGRLEDVVRR